jgi:hypothetical protein
MQLCCGILLDGNACPYRSFITTNENLFVCNLHKNFTLSKKEHILKVVVENEFNKQRKEFIESLNREIIDNHEFDIPLINKYGLIIDFAIVDKNDYEEVNKYNWYKDASGYAIRNYRIDPISRMHHMIIGKPDDGFVVDHINGNRLDNTRLNLRVVTESGNNQNRPKIIKENTSSKYIGVAFDKKHKKWRVRCAKKNLGSFENEIDAAKRYDTYALLKFGKDAQTNNLVKYSSIFFYIFSPSFDLLLKNLIK